MPHINRTNPYGQGGLAALGWAVEHHIIHHRWDIDSEDWLHHPDAEQFRLFAEPTDREAHRKYILGTLPLRLAIHALWRGANDFHFHVSFRTASYINDILNCISDSTRRLGCEPKYVMPSSYLHAAGSTLV